MLSSGTPAVERSQSSVQLHPPSSRVTVRWLAALALACLAQAGQAQQDELSECLGRLAADARFAPLAGRIVLGTLPDPPPPAAIDTGYPDAAQQKLVGAWAAARTECVKAAARVGNAMYRPPLVTIGIEAENRLLAAAEVLHNRKLSWGEFNRERLVIAEAQRARIAALRQRSEAQRSLHEQADRHAREREQLQREVEEAERQANAARAQAAQAQAQATQAQRRLEEQRPRPYSKLPPPRPVRDCFRFENRVICTSAPR